MQQKRHLVLVPVVFLTGITAVAQPRPALLATTVKQDKDTTVMIRHVDGNVFDINSAETPPPILVIVRYKGRDYPQMTLTGGKDFPPWGFRTAFARDLNGDNKQEMIIGSFGSFGGSGGARYMTILSGVGESARLYTLPRGESENIHDSTFYLLKDKDGQPGIAITHPLMDGESRADATHWRVATYRLSIPKSGTAGTVKVVPLGEKRTAKRHSERLPDTILSPPVRFPPDGVLSHHYSKYRKYRCNTTYVGMSKLSHEPLNLRHLQGHVGQLSELLMACVIDTGWISKAP